MNQARENQRQTGTDSFFGMALTQSFLGVAYGPTAELAWEAGEMTSALYQDRMDAKAAKAASGTNERESFELGVKKSLSGVFAGLHNNIRQTVAEAEAAIFTPSYAMNRGFGFGMAA